MARRIVAREELRHLAMFASGICVPPGLPACGPGATLHAVCLPGLLAGYRLRCGQVAGWLLHLIRAAVRGVTDPGEL